MGLLKRQTPYARRLQPAVIDIQAEERKLQDMRLEMSRVDEWARESAFGAVAKLDPINQLVERAHRQDQAIEALQGAVNGLADQMANMLTAIREGQ
jgi:hypothetical protein